MSLESLIALIAPPLCATCGGSAEPRRTLCPRCESELGSGLAVHLTIPHTTTAWAARPYTGVARDLITALKFSNRLAVAKRAAELIGAEIPPSMLVGSLVPVPPSPRRRMWRGFDPAAEIAERLSRLTGQPLDPCLRRADGPRQVGRAKTDRLTQPPRIWARGHVPLGAILIDDVTTTGATFAACAAALRAAGCASITAAAFAATPDGKSALGRTAWEA